MSRSPLRRLYRWRPARAVWAAIPVRLRRFLPLGRFYRAGVGPYEEYDLVGGSQFALLFALGLRQHHRVLDFGCGSLRAGRLLIPYLERGNYHGLDPARWLVKEGLAREVGPSQKRLKRPQFYYNDDFTCPDAEFDFVLAQSIFSHTDRATISHTLGEFHRVLRPGGLAAVTFIVGEGEEYTGEGWIGGAARYRAETVASLIAESPLVGTPIPWWHPRGQRWYLLAHKAADLPPPDELERLRGKPLGAQTRPLLD